MNPFTYIKNLMIASIMSEMNRVSQTALGKRQQDRHDREGSSGLLNQSNRRFELGTRSDRSRILRYLWYLT